MQPFGIFDDGEMEPRWTYRCTGTIQRVEEIDTFLANTVMRVRMQPRIHKICQEEESDYIDLSQDEEEANRRAERLLIRPNLNKIRNRNKSDDFEAENLVPVSNKAVDNTISLIEDNAGRVRTHFLERVLPRLVGFDIAAGEAEAIARDELETELEIDDEIARYLERLSVAELLSTTMKDSKTFSKEFIEQRIGIWIDTEFDKVRTDLIKSQKSNGIQKELRRLMRQNEGLVSKRVEQDSPTLGVTRSRPRNNAPEYYLDQ